MQKWPTSALLLCAISISTVLLAANAATAGDKGWVVRQYIKGAGSTELYCTAHGSKFVYLSTGLTIMASAPKWQATMFNPLKSAYYPQTLKDLARQIASISSVTGQDLLAKDWKKDKAGTFLGHPAIRYIFERKLSDARTQNGETWYATDIQTYKEFAEYISATCSLPNLGLIPLQSQHEDRYGRKYESVSTREIKPFTAPPHFWEVPKNYKSKPSPFSMADELEEDFRQDPEFTRVLRH